ncbi:hypothetical protein [Haloarcula terrestris]|nr:hypothetical protein [Haloarcula terrestris]
MAHEDSHWNPKGATEMFNGFEVWDHGVWPGDVNQNDTTADDDEE